jgi:hypothetical protein
MAIEIDPDKLKQSLRELYFQYLTDRHSAQQRAKDLDGLWSGSFLLEPSVEFAIHGLRYMYVEPLLSIKEAQHILKTLQ